MIYLVDSVSTKLGKGLFVSNELILTYRAMHAATVSIHPLVIAGW